MDTLRVRTMDTRDIWDDTNGIVTGAKEQVEATLEVAWDREGNQERSSADGFKVSIKVTKYIAPVVALLMYAWR